MDKDVTISGRGGKGGGGDSADSTLISRATARFTEAISEGPIVGLVDGSKSIFYDETPIQNEDGSFNFNNVVWQSRKGNPDDDHINGHEGVEITNQVAEEVKNSTGAVTRTVTEPNADAVRVIVRINSLFKIGKGGQAGTNSMSYQISVRPFGGAWTVAVNQNLVDEKTTSAVQMAHRVVLPAGGHPWDIRVTKVSADSESDQDQSSMTFESFITLIEGRYTYPHTAFVSHQVEAETVGAGVPERAYEVMGRIIQVPSNYDSHTKVYTGIWDGTFIQAWTNNPAWIFYDLLDNDRYGLGEFITESELSGLKWKLYAIGQYCDELIPSGFKDDSSEDIMEHRFEFNGVIRNRQEAFHVLQSITTSFRGMGYWALGQIFATADMPSDPVRVVTPANVVNGDFKYSSTALKARHTVAMVRWNDPQDFFRTSTELVINNEGLKKYGWREKRLDMLGCTSRGLAHRYGKWALDVENTETETVEYQCGFDHIEAAPGEIIAIADPRKAGVRMGGRVVSHSEFTISPYFPAISEFFLDGEVALVDGETYAMWVTKADGTLAKVNITNGAGATDVIYTDEIGEDIAPDSMFLITGTDIEPRQYRILSVNEVEENVFQVTGLFHDPNKYARIEDNILFDEITYSRDVRAVRAKNLSATEIAYVDDAGITRTRLRLNWERPDSVIVKEYLISITTPLDVKRFVASTAETTYDIQDLERGDHIIYVVTVDRQGHQALPASIPFTITSTDSISTGVVSGLKLRDADGSTEFFGKDVTIDWQNLFPEFTGEVATIENPSLYDFNTVDVFHAPTNTLIRSSRVVGNTFTYTFDHNTRDADAASLSVAAARSLRFEVKLTSKRGLESLTASIAVSNPVPTPVAPVVNVSGSNITVAMPSTASTDVKSMKVWIETSTGFDHTAKTPKFDGPGGFMNFQGVPSTTYFVKAGYVDFFDDTVSVSSEVTVTTDSISIPVAPDVPENLVLSSDLLSTGGARINASWDDNDETDLQDYDVQIKEGSGNFVSFSTLNSFMSWDVPAGVAIQVKVRARTSSSLLSAFTTTETINASTDTDAPAIPTNFVVTAGFKAFSLEWDANSEADLSHYEVVRKGVATPLPNNASTAFTFTTSSNTMVDHGFGDGVTRYFWVRAVDTSGNRSDWSATASATTARLVSTDIQGIIKQDSMVSGTVLPEIVSALPSTGLFDGKLVVLTTDNKLYRYSTTESAWSNATDAVDIEGEITENQIAAGAITAGKIAANTIVASKVAIGDFENLYFDTNHDDPNYLTEFLGTFSIENASDSVAFDSDRVVRVAREAGLTGRATMPVFRVESDDAELFVEYVASMTEDLGGNCFLQFRFSVEDDMSSPYIVNFGVSASITPTLRKGTVVVPTGYRFCQVHMVKNSSGTATEADFGRVIIRRKSKGDLIVDGAITADKLDAGELITGSAQIADAIITDAKIVDLDAAKIKADSVIAGSVKVEGRSFSSISKSDTFTDAIDELWEKIVPGNSDMVITTDPEDVITGSQSMQTNNTATNDDYIWLNSREKVPFDPGKLYKVTFRIKNEPQTGHGTRRFFLGVTGWKSDRVTKVNKDGLDARSSQNYMVASNLLQSIIPSEFTEYVGWIKGSKPVGESATGLGNSIDDPRIVHADTRYISALALLNYPDGDDVITVDSVRIESIAESDAGILVNQGETSIDPGKVTISGGTTLSDWRKGGDETKIDGGEVSANTVRANALTIGNRSIHVDGLVFTSTGDTLSWTAGAFRYLDDDGSNKYTAIASGSVTYTSSKIHIHWVKDAPTLTATTSSASSITGDANLAIATYNGGQKIGNFLGRTIIDGDFIKTGAIEADHIKANTITASQIASDTIQASNIAANAINTSELNANAVTAAKIAAGAVTADKITANAITADKIAAGAVTADKVSISSNVNLISNATFTTFLNWHQETSGDIGGDSTVSLRLAGSTFTGNSTNVGQIITINTAARTNGWAAIVGKPVDSTGAPLDGYSVSEGDRYEFSAKVYPLRSKADLKIRWMDSSGVLISDVTVDTITTEPGSSNPAFWPRSGGQAEAPTGAAYAQVVVEIFETTTTDNAFVFVSEPMLSPTVLGANLGAFNPGGNTVIDGGSIVADSVTAGMGIFSGPLQSSNFISGSTGWKIDEAGDVEFNNLIVRDSVVIGAVSDGATVINGSEQTIASGNAAAVASLGEFKLGQFWQIACQFSYRSKRSFNTNGGGKGGDTSSNNYERTRGYLQIRTKTDGVWSAFETEHTFGISGLNFTWNREDAVVSKMGVFEEVEARLYILTANSSTGASVSGHDQFPTVNVTNIDDITLVARALVR